MNQNSFGVSSMNLLLIPMARNEPAAPSGLDTVEAR